MAYQFVQDYGIPLAEVARQLGVSMSAISNAITMRTKEQVKLVNYVRNFHNFHVDTVTKNDTI